MSEKISLDSSEIEYEIVYGLPYESETDGSDRKRKSDC